MEGYRAKPAEKTIRSRGDSYQADTVTDGVVPKRLGSSAVFFEVLCGNCGREKVRRRYEGGTKARDNGWAWIRRPRTSSSASLSLIHLLFYRRVEPPPPRLPQTAARHRKATAKRADQRRCHPRRTLSASLRPQTRMCNAVYSPAPRRAGLLGEHCVSGENRVFVSVMA